MSFVDPMEDPRHETRVRLRDDIAALREDNAEAVSDEALAEIAAHGSEGTITWAILALAQREIDRRAAEVAPS